MANEPLKQKIELEKSCPFSNFCTINANKKIEQKVNASLWQKLFGSKEHRLGFINYDEYHDSKKIGYISTIYVYRDSQRCGIGTLLFNAALQDLREKGLDKVYWCSTDEAVPFYLKNGATKRKENKSWGANPMKIRLREHTCKEKMSKFLKHNGHYFLKNDLFE
jgi:GNAT superfamily N-acetyltransferase